MSAGDASVEPYTALAEVYDLVMQHVDYGDWARYIQSLLVRHAPHGVDVLELGCGTGSLAREMMAIKSYRYLGTDASPDMIREARKKPASSGLDFAVADFRKFEIDRRFDVALLLYDGINYLLEESDIQLTLACTRKHVKTGGLFIFDQSTPANSLNNQEFFEDSGGTGTVSYVRQSEYDTETYLHHTHFDIEIGGKAYHEHHVQRAYTIDTIREQISDAEWTVVAALDGFGDEMASDASERVHWILRAS